jgi:hypothetical protein
MISQMKNNAQPPLYDKAIEAKANILQEMTACHIRQEELKKQLADIEGFFRSVNRLAESQSNLPATVTDRPMARGRASKRETIENATKQLLQQESVASTSRLLVVLERQGISVGGANPEGNLSAILSKSRAFINSRAAGGWMLGGDMTQDSDVTTV